MAISHVRLPAVAEREVRKVCLLDAGVRTLGAHLLKSFEQRESATARNNPVAMPLVLSAAVGERYLARKFAREFRPDAPEREVALPKLAEVQITFTAR